MCTAAAALDSELLDRLPDVLICVDAAHRVVTWNRAAERLYGYTRDEAIGRRAPELLASRFAQPFAQIVERCEQTGGWRGTIVNTAKDGRGVTVDTHWSARYDDGGSCIGVVAVGRELVAGLADPVALTDPPAALARIAGSVAHDLNNALAVVVNYAALVARELDRLHGETGEQSLSDLGGDVAEIRTAAARGVQLSRQLFAASLAAGDAGAS